MPFLLLPLRRSTQKQAPLPVVMSGVRAGERVLQIGVDDVQIASAIARHPGINGRCAFLVADDRSASLARQAATEAMAVADVEMNPALHVPFDDGAFDLVVVHARSGVPATLDGDALRRLLDDILRTLGPGGRAVVMSPGTAVGLSAWFRSSTPPPAGVDDAMRQTGYRPVRVLADKEGYLFTEGLKPRA